MQHRLAQPPVQPEDIACKQLVFFWSSSSTASVGPSGSSSSLVMPSTKAAFASMAAFPACLGVRCSISHAAVTGSLARSPAVAVMAASSMLASMGRSFSSSRRFISVRLPNTRSRSNQACRSKAKRSSRPAAFIFSFSILAPYTLATLAFVSSHATALASVAKSA